MGELYRRHHCTVIPYMTADAGKECPRGLIESMTCGVAILISDAAPFSSFAAKHNCGCVYKRNVEGFALALEAGLRSYLQIGKNAEECAHTYFDREQTYRRTLGSMAV